MTVSGPQPAAKSSPVKWEGVNFINNNEYTKEGLHVWRPYGIGSGKSFQTAKARSKPKQKPVLEEAPQNRNNSDDDESCNDEESDLFFCPEEGCVMSFVHYSSLEKHLD